jgi:Polyketide cyclase / dehydrase and lipid transport
MFYAVLIALAAFLIYVWSKPAAFSFARSITIAAKPAEIHPHINNLKAMNQWNPYAAADPKSVIAYEGPEAGPGAIYTWNGGKMGAGRYEIKQSEPLKVTSALQMIKPMAANNVVVHSLEPVADGTKVTWAMSGTTSFPVRILHTVMNMEKMLGREFDKGLVSLKAVVEQKKLG